VTLNFRKDAPLETAALAQLVARTRGYQLTPDGKLICRFDPVKGQDGIERAREVLRALLPLRKTQ
jgi:hypothetical protein